MKDRDRQIERERANGYAEERKVSLIVLDILHNFQFHHQRSRQVNWQCYLFDCHGVAFKAADWYENLFVSHQLLGIH
jgi:hypothetical protein